MLEKYPKYRENVRKRNDSSGGQLFQIIFLTFNQGLTKPRANINIQFSPNVDGH